MEHPQATLSRAESESWKDRRLATALAAVMAAAATATIGAQDGTDYRGAAALVLASLAGLVVVGIADLFLLAYIFMPLPQRLARKVYRWAAGIVLMSNAVLLVTGSWSTIMFLWTSRSGRSSLGLDSTYGGIAAFLPFASTVLAVSAPLMRRIFTQGNTTAMR